MPVNASMYVCINMYNENIINYANVYRHFIYIKIELKSLLKTLI